MGTRKENTVQEIVTSGQDLVSTQKPMTEEQFNTEVSFKVSVSIIRKMLDESVITPSEYRKIETIIAKIYPSFSCSLL